MKNTMVTTTKDFNCKGQNYRLFISHNKKYSEPFQPLYFLDANSQAEAMLANNSETDDASILYIGIGYQDGVNIQTAREKDYTLPAAGEAYQGGGGAENFHSFIVDVVKPYVASAYRIDTGKQTLAGHSYGGHFTLYVAFNHAASFQNYVAASPAIWYGAGALVPSGELALGENINLLSVLIGEYEEKVSSFASESEAERIEMINADPKLTARNLAERLISNKQRCDFVFCPGQRHPGVIKDYAKQANIIAGRKPLVDGT